MSYARRLERLEHLLGCPVCGQALACQGCEPSDPLPEHISDGLNTLVAAIHARVGVEGLRRALYRHPLPSPSTPCPRCQTPRRCTLCSTRHSQALLRAIGLSPEEDALCQSLLEACQALDRASGQGHAPA